MKRHYLLNSSLLGWISAVVLAAGLLAVPVSQAGEPPISVVSADKTAVDDILTLGTQFQEMVDEYSNDLESLANLLYDQRKGGQDDRYKEDIETLTARELVQLLAAIGQLEMFVDKYPKSKQYTPEALFRLSELYFLRAFTVTVKDTAGLGMDEKLKEINRVSAEQQTYYRRSRLLAERIISDFPEYRRRDKAYYAIARACGRLDPRNVPCTQHALTSLVEEYPDSDRASNAYYRLGQLFYSDSEEVEVPATELRYPLLETVMAEDAGLLARTDGKTAEAQNQIMKREQDMAKQELDKLKDRRIGKRRYCNMMARHYLVKAYALPMSAWPSLSRYSDVLFLMAALEFSMMGHEDRAKEYFERYMNFYEANADDSDAWQLVARLRLDQAQRFYAYIFTTVYLAGMGDMPDGSGAEAMKRRVAAVGTHEWWRQVHLYFIENSETNRQPMDVIEAYRSMLTMYPLHPDNPEMHYNMMLKFAQNIYREEDKNSVAFMDQEREAMAKNYGEGSPWHLANKDNPTALSKAYKYLKEIISVYGDDHFAMGDKMMEAGDEEGARREYTKAAQVYRNFLTQFPNDPDSYDRRKDLGDALFYAGRVGEALVEYEAVRDSKLGLHFQGNAALQVIVCYDSLLKKDGLLDKEMASLELTAEEFEARKPLDKDNPVVGFSVPKREMPDIRVKYLQAIDKYLEWYDKGYDASVQWTKAKAAQAPKEQQDLWDQILKLNEENRSQKNRMTTIYTVAMVNLMYHDFDRAKDYFSKVIDEFPGTEQAVVAHRQIVFMLGREGRLQEILAWVKKSTDYVNSHKGVAPKAEAELLEFVANIEAHTSYKLAQAYQKNGEYELAGQQFERFSEQYLQHESAPVALLNAAAMYMKAKLFSSSSKMYKRFVNRYPDHPDTPGIRLQLALVAYQGFELDEAETQFTALYSRGNKVDRYYRCMALYFRSQLFEYDQRYKEAAQGFQDYSQQCDNIKEADIPESFRKELPPKPVAGALYQSFEIYRKMKDFKGALQSFTEFEKKYSRNPDFSFRIIQGYYLFSEEYRKRNDQKMMMDYYDRIISYFASRPEFKNTEDPKVLYAHHFAAMAEFIKLEPEFKRFTALKLDCAGFDDKLADRQLKQKYPGSQGQRKVSQMNEQEKILECTAIEAETCGNSQKSLVEEGAALAKKYRDLANTYTAPYSVVAKYRMGHISEIIADQLYSVAEGDLPKQFQRFKKFSEEQIVKLEEAMDEVMMAAMMVTDEAQKANIDKQMAMVQQAINATGMNAEKMESSFREPRMNDANQLYVQAVKNYQSSYKIIKLLAMFPEMATWRERLKQALARPKVRAQLEENLKLLRRDVRPTSLDIQSTVPVDIDFGMAPEEEKAVPETPVQSGEAAPAAEVPGVVEEVPQQPAETGEPPASQSVEASATVEDGAAEEAVEEEATEEGAEDDAAEAGEGGAQ